MNIEQNKRYKDLIEKCGLEKLDKDIQSRTDKRLERTLNLYPVVKSKE